MFEPTLVYIHGYLGNKNSETVNVLKTSGYVVESITYDCLNIKESMILLTKFVVDSYIKHEGNIVIIGNSFGGMYANFISNLFSIETILVNPFLDISQLSLENIALLDGIDIHLLKTDIKKGCPRNVIISENDEIVDCEYTKKYFDGKAKITIDYNNLHQLIDHTILLNTVKEVSLELMTYNE